MPEPVAKTDSLGVTPCSIRCFHALDPLIKQGERDVLLHRELWDQMKVLKHEPEV